MDAETKKMAKALRRYAKVIVNPLAYPEDQDAADAMTQAATLIERQAAEIKRLRKHAEEMAGALNAMYRATPEHDEHCPIGVIHGCTCDLKPANDQAREALAAYRAEYPEEK